MQAMHPCHMSLYKCMLPVCKESYVLCMARMGSREAFFPLPVILWHLLWLTPRQPRAYGLSAKQVRPT